MLRLMVKLRLQELRTPVEFYIYAEIIFLNIVIILKYLPIFLRQDDNVHTGS